uniref:Phosphopantetheine--protein transferase domain-containing protein n=1 Tax=Candidatus Kentrum sp. LFY TaxID=2126342 RepID=A0A450UNQ5_9GAMM|nr:MAG: phosphopantetheine--protein transferase domain-containing protein [Candidatus Kentron sp. LFY]
MVVSESRESPVPCGYRPHRAIPFGSRTDKMPALLWRSPPTDLVLARDEIHVWRVPLNLPWTRIGVLQSTLGQDELQRAERFCFPKHRRHFIVARGVLRALLAGYLHESPARIDFEYNRYGKPFLKGRKPILRGDSPDCVETDDIDNAGIEFNLSHSEGMALYAFSLNRKVGIDVEWMQRKVDDSERIVERFFSPREVQVLSGVPEHVRKEAFLGCWTRKEAYIKARGKGLSIPLNEFEVIPTLEETGQAANGIRRHHGDRGTENENPRPPTTRYPPPPMDCDNGQGCRPGVTRVATEAATEDATQEAVTEAVIHAEFQGHDAWEPPFLSDISIPTTCHGSHTRWAMRTFTVDDDYIATLVVEGEGWEMKYWQWE